MSSIMNYDNIEILIPTYNEEKNIPITVEGLKKMVLQI